MTLAQLRDLLQPTEFHGGGEGKIAGLAVDSRAVQPGEVFFAVPGTVSDGTQFASQAIEQGASAVVASRAPEEVWPTPWLVVGNVREAMAQVAGAFHGHPDREVELLGVTGTNGKTTSAWVLQHLVQDSGRRCGLLSTIRYQDGVEETEATHTTPESIHLLPWLARMRENGCQAAAMEVSSHAIDQARVGGLRFQVGLFTNLSQDHLDYHKTMEAYYQVKKRFIEETREAGGWVVINSDDAYGQRMLRELGRERVCTIGFGAGADFRMSQLRSDFEGCSFALAAKGRSFMVRAPYLGRFNAYNLVGALAAVSALGLNLRGAVRALQSAPQVPGRMEDLTPGQKRKVLVDYAHTPDALSHVLATLRDLKPKRLFTVFGCGGDRDRGKRPLMARAAAALSDGVIVTNDNPRTEDPAQIFGDIRGGLLASVPHEVIADRREAIRTAVNLAESGDIVLIAGKGHETYQEIEGVRHEFSDQLHARIALRDAGQDRAAEERQREGGIS